MYGYDPETKQQVTVEVIILTHHGKKAHHVRSHVKSMLVFFDIHRIVHKEFLPPILAKPFGLTNPGGKIYYMSFEAAERPFGLNLSLIHI